MSYFITTALVFSLSDGPNSPKLGVDRRLERALMTWAPPCLLSSHPDPGNRFGVCYILFRRSAEND